MSFFLNWIVAPCAGLAVFWLVAFFRNKYVNRWRPIGLDTPLDRLIWIRHSRIPGSEQRCFYSLDGGGWISPDHPLTQTFPADEWKPLN